MKKYIAIILAVGLLTGCGSSEQASDDLTDETAAVSETEESVEGSEYYRDALDLIDTLEYSHIAFGMELVPDGYEAAKAEYLESAEAVDNIHDFEFITLKYLTSLNDLHTYIKCANKSSEYLDINMKIKDGKAYTTDENGRATDNYIVSVGGVPTEDIFKTTEQYFPAENEYAYDAVHARFRLKEFLEFSGCVKNGDTYTVVLSDGTEKEVPLIKYEPDTTPQKAMEVEMKGDVLYADINHFFDKSSYDTLNDSIETNVEEGSLKTGLDELKKGIENGAKKVVIDLRDNPGGLYMYAAYAAKALNVSLPYGDMYNQNSELFREQSEYASNASYEDHTIDDYTGSLNSARKNPDIDLVLLVNLNSASASVLFASRVQDGGIGTIIGQPPLNSPTQMGGVMYYTLPNTSSLVGMSGSYILRPDKNADQNALIPDIILDDETDALEYTLNNYFK